MSESERKLLEQYGLNPDEFLSEPSPKVRTLSLWLILLADILFLWCELKLDS